MLYFPTRFCKERAFNEPCTSVFMSILNEVFILDSKIDTTINSSEASFNRFKSLLLKHSVYQPPHSIKVFGEKDVKAMVDFVIERYFKNFKLYSYVFAEQTKNILNQVSTNGFEYPKTPIRLKDGIQID